MIDIVLIHSNTDKSRERNLNFILYYYKELIPDSNIILVEQDTVTKNDIIDKYVNNHVKILSTTGFFCRSLCLNVGYKYSKTEHILFSDNDCIIDEFFLKNIESYLKLDVVIPYNMPVVNLTELQTNEFIDNFKVFNKNRTDLIVRGNYISNGGVLLINSQTYYNLGGYDPRFIGWGGEDDAFLEKVRKYHTVIRPNVKLFHLNHPKGINSRETNPYYMQNYNYYIEYSKMDKISTTKKINEIGFNHLKK
jgi:predicted glycosyltransferase involved in capsule biosynthesis